LRPSLSCFKAADWKAKGFPHGEAAKPQEAQIRFACNEFLRRHRGTEAAEIPNWEAKSTNKVFAP